MQQRFGVSLVSLRVRLSPTAGREKRLSPLGIQFIKHIGSKLGQGFLAGEVVHATLHLLRFALHSIKLRIEHIPLGPLGITGVAREARARVAGTIALGVSFAGRGATAGPPAGVVITEDGCPSSVLSALKTRVLPFLPLTTTPLPRGTRSGIHRAIFQDLCAAVV